MEGIEFLVEALSKQYVELQRAVTIKELNTNPYFSLSSVYFVNINEYTKLINFHL